MRCKVCHQGHQEAFDTDYTCPPCRCLLKQDFIIRQLHNKQLTMEKLNKLVMIIEDIE